MACTGEGSGPQLCNSGAGCARDRFSRPGCPATSELVDYFHSRAVRVGVSPAVGSRWFRESGGGAR